MLLEMTSRIFAQVQTGTKSRSFVFQLPDQGPAIDLPTRDGVRGDGEMGLLRGPMGAVEIRSPLPPASDVENLRVNSKDRLRRKKGGLS